MVMDDWVDRGIEPPANAYPGIQRHSLVSLDEYRATFPVIPGMQPPRVMNEVTELQFGPLFSTGGGVQTQLPPGWGRKYTAMVPRPDEDGVGVDGIRTIFTRAPIGTNTGWNLRPGFRAPDLCSLAGSFVLREDAGRADHQRRLPKVARGARYKDHAGCEARSSRPRRELVGERFLLEEDADTFVRAADASDILR